MSRSGRYRFSACIALRQTFPPAKLTKMFENECVAAKENQSNILWNGNNGIIYSTLPSRNQIVKIRSGFG